MNIHYSVSVKGIGSYVTPSFGDCVSHIIRYSDTFGWSNVRVIAFYLCKEKLPF